MTSRQERLENLCRLIALLDFVGLLLLGVRHYFGIIIENKLQKFYLTTRRWCYLFIQLKNHQFGHPIIFYNDRLRQVVPDVDRPQ